MVLERFRHFFERKSNLLLRLLRGYVSILRRRAAVFLNLVDSFPSHVTLVVMRRTVGHAQQSRTAQDRPAAQPTPAKDLGFETPADRLRAVLQ
jgi:hypothetical protein